MDKSVGHYVTAITEAAERMSEAFDSLATENEAMLEALSLVRSSERNFAAKSQDLEVEVQQARAQRASHVQVIEQLQSEIDDYRTQVTDLRHEVNQLSEQLATSRELAEQLRDINRRTEYSLHEAEQLRLTATAAIRETENKLALADNNFNSLSRQLAEAQGDARAAREFKEDYERSLVSFAVRHTMYDYGQVPPEGQADRLVNEVLAERETIKNMLFARKAQG